MYLHAYGANQDSKLRPLEFFPLVIKISGVVTNSQPAFTVEIKGLAVGILWKLLLKINK